MSEDKMYTISQIRKAFWNNFHKQGEMFFGYLGTEEENEHYTLSEWDEFRECLEKASTNENAA